MQIKIVHFNYLIKPPLSRSGAQNLFTSKISEDRFMRSNSDITHRGKLMNALGISVLNYRG